MSVPNGEKVKVEIMMKGSAIEILEAISPVLESHLCTGYRISNIDDEVKVPTKFELNDEVLYDDGVVQWTGKIIFKQGDKYGIQVFGKPSPVVIDPTHLSHWE